MNHTITPGTNGTGFTAPVRNRYFFGKLLDVHHLEMEQRYFLETSRLINRLTLGSGVLCGLRVEGMGNGRVAVSPGVAVDGYGREIVVTERVVLDLDQLDKERPGGRPESSGREGIVLCLAYHECDVEPSPVMVADCEPREDCVPGAVRERFKFELMDAAFAPFPEDPCSILGRRPDSEPEPPMDARRTAAMEAMLRDSLESRVVRPQAGEIEVKPSAGQMAQNARERLCAVFQPPCAPGPACVPVALIENGDDGLEVRECPPRRTIYSNAVLLDLILCLMERVEQCCNRRITVTAPKVVDLWPEPGQSVELADFGKAPLNLDEGGIAISFDRPMNRERLEAPAEWLRLMIVPDLESTVGIPVELELDRVGPKTLDGDVAGQTAYYKVLGIARSRVLGGLGRSALAAAERAPAIREAGDTADAAGDDTAGDDTAQLTLRELLKLVKADSAHALVLMRSDDVTQIAAKDDAELLDADFHGTLLSTEECDLLWTLQAISVAFGGLVKSALATPPSPMPSLPSGNGIEGGVFHSSFQIG